MAKAIITGAAGFVGRQLQPALVAAGHEVTAVGREGGDLADPAAWQKLPSAEVVVHLAGKSFVPDSWTAPVPYLHANVLGTVAGLEYCRRTGAHFVFLSSYLYGNPQVLPIPETAPIEVLNPYALSKKLAEDACRFYADIFRIPVTVLRLFNLYGAGQPGHFLLPTIVAQVRRRGPIVVKDLAPRRDYVYIDDVVDAIVRVVAGPCAGWEVFNIGSGESYSVKEVIDLVQELEKIALPVVVDGVRRQGEIMDTVADISRARERLGWQPRWPLRRGLEAMLQLT